MLSTVIRMSLNRAIHLVCKRLGLPVSAFSSSEHIGSSYSDTLNRTNTEFVI